MFVNKDFNISLLIAPLASFLFCAIAVASPIMAEDNLMMDGTVYPNSVPKGESLAINLTVRNIGNFPLQDLDVQIVSPGLETISEKKWPSDVFSNSTMQGLYILKAMSEGRYNIGATASYFVNDTKTNDIKYFSKSIPIGEVTVNWGFGDFFSPFWQGVGTTILGGLLGLIITKTADHFANKSKMNVENAENKRRFKGLLMSELKENKQYIQMRNVKPPLLIRNWELIKTTGLYHYCKEKVGLEDKIIILYSKYREYNEFGRRTNDNELGDEITNLTTEIYNSIESL